MGYLTEEDLVIALSTQFNIPYLPIGNFTFDEAAHKLMPKELIQKYTCVPLERIGNLLTVVIADPTNEQAIRDIEAATKCKVQIFVATTKELTAAIQQYFHIPATSMLGSGKQFSEFPSHSAAVQKANDKTTQKT